MRKYEYQLFEFDSRMLSADGISKQLAKLGNEGWIIVQASQQLFMPVKHVVTVLCMRPLPGTSSNK